MLELNGTWSATYVQVLSCFLVLVLGLPAFLSQVVRSDLRPLIDEGRRTTHVILLSVSVIGVSLMLIWREILIFFVVTKETLGVVVHFAMSIVFVLAPFLCALSLRSMQRDRIVIKAFRQCRPPGFFFRFRKGGVEKFRKPLKDLCYLGEFGCAVSEKEYFLERLDRLIYDWRYNTGDGDAVRELRQDILPELVRISLAAVVGGGQSGNKECFKLARDILKKLILSREASGEDALSQLRLLSVRLIERASSGQDPALKDLVESFIDLFRDYDADLFSLGEYCLRLSPTWGTIPAVIKLRSRSFENDDSKYYLFGLSALLWKHGPAMRRWVDEMVFSLFHDEQGALDAELRQAQRFNYVRANFAAFDAIGEVLASRTNPNSAQKPVTVHQSFVGFHL